MDEGSSNPTEPSIDEKFGIKYRRKKKKTEQQLPTNDAILGEPEKNAATVKDNSDASGVGVCAFDESVENHFRAVDTISKLCGEEEEEEEEEFGSLNDDYIKLLSSRISFLREWRHLIHEPRVVRFSSDGENTNGEDNCSGIKLPQFSSATVPKEVQSEGNDCRASSRDFIMYVGGPIWGLDWSPHHYEAPNRRISCEFVAVASHPPGSSFHKLGDPQSGPGIVQIWGFPSVVVEEDESMSQKSSKRCHTNKKPTNEPKKPRGRPRKNPLKDNIEEPQKPREKRVIDGSPDNLALEDSIDKPKKPRGRPRKKLIDGSPDNLALMETIDKPKKPRGRPRKKLIDGSPDNLDSNNQLSPALAIQFPEDSSEMHAIEGVPGSSHEHTVHNEHPKKPKKSKKNGSTSAPTPRISGRKRKLKNEFTSGIYYSEKFLPFVTAEENRECTIATDSLPLVTGEENIDSIIASGSLPLPTREENRQAVIATNASPQLDGAISNGIIENGPSEFGMVACSIPSEDALPRLMLCIAHNGKVAWDVKWKPLDVHGSICKHRMGYLAVLLGDGSLKVWDVPLPRTIKTLHSLSGKEDTDPRFVNLEPVFRCTTVKCFDRQSIPLTVEWSAMPHDYLLAGCHDGSVALWKFSPSSSSITNDTRPLLCFNADSSPIRAVAWAPPNSDNECANVVVTAGHEGLKFWDIRDPYRPLWNLHPAPRFIYSLDWLPDPGCLIVSFDDGTMKLLSLVKAMCDGPVNGKALVGTTQPGFNTYFCTSFAIWSVHISRSTGMVAYCSADGTVKHFQHHPKAVEKGFYRNRTPHFMCGFLTDKESVVTVHTPLLDTPLTSKKPATDGGESHLCAKNLLSGSNCEKQANAEAEAQTPDNQTLAIWYKNDPTMEPEPEKTPPPLKSQDASKSRSISKKIPEHDQALVCVDEVQERENGREAKAGTVESFPPKIIAMHRVRWNMNKGRERWLCYGGAAGIVRCQEIIKS